MNISASGVVELKDGSKLRAVETDSVGANEAWSADRLYHYLCFLEGLVPRTVSVLGVESWGASF
jgi:hypothetical protein